MRTVKDFIKSNKETVYKHFWFAVLLVLASGFLLWKCRYGFGNVDESFYITIPYRLFKGDALFLHEWHLSQMSGILTLPIVSLYLTLKGSTVGIVLFLRYVCTIAQIITAIFVYTRLNKINLLGAVVSSISYLLYIPFGIMALSYNSMAIMFLVICTVIILTAENKKSIQYVIAGLFYAGAVLCCPYLAFVFLIYILIVCVRELLHKFGIIRNNNQFYFFDFKGMICLSIGAAIAAVGFIIFVLSRASISEIIKAFPTIMDDPEHPSISFIEIAKGFIEFIIESNTLSRLIYPILVSLAIVCLFDKDRLQRKLYYLCIALICVILLLSGHYSRNNYINHIMWPINVFAFFIFILNDKKIIKNIFYVSWITGILYAFCLNATSNQKFYAISSASAVSLVGSIMMIGIFLSELSKGITTSSLKNFIVILLSVLMVMQISMQVLLRYNSVFWETDMESQNVQIEDGFNKGLYVTKDKYDEYYNALENLSGLEEYNAENVLYLSKNTWYYLATDYNMATYSAWLAGVDEHSVNRLKAYYKLNPDKMPDVVYADKNYESTAKYFCKKLDYKIDKDGEAIILVKG